MLLIGKQLPKARKSTPAWPLATWGKTGSGLDAEHPSSPFEYAIILDMTIRAIEHIQLAMPADEEDAARAFYSGVLGLDEVPKPPELAKRGGAWFENGSVRVHLGVEENFRPAKKAHPAFLVDDLDLLVTRLNEAGVTNEWDTKLRGFERAYVSDPFGNRIELMQPF